MRRAKLLVSVHRPSEVEDAVMGGADIVDVKDVSQGSLGLPDLDVVEEVVRRVGERCEVSLAIGDVRAYSHHLKYIVKAVEGLEVDYVKVGLAAGRSEEAKEILRALVKRVNERGACFVVVAYADYSRAGSLDPVTALKLAAACGACGFMVDTFVKDGGPLFSTLSYEVLEEIVRLSKSLGLLTAVAGGLRKEHIPLCLKLGVDVVGVRSAVCVGGREGKISRDLVRELKDLMMRCEVAGGH